LGITNPKCAACKCDGSSNLRNCKIEWDCPGIEDPNCKAEHCDCTRGEADSESELVTCHYLWGDGEDLIDKDWEEVDGDGRSPFMTDTTTSSCNSYQLCELKQTGGGFKDQ